MSKKSQKSSSQQQQQQQQQQQSTQPKNQAEASRQRRATSTQSKSAAASAAIRDSCDLSGAIVESAPLVGPEREEARNTSENDSEKVRHQQQQQQQATSKFERNKRARFQSGAENKPAPAGDRMGDMSQGASLAPCQEQAVGKLKEGEENICAACAKPIRERYLLMALDKRWHEDCLKCACCDCRLGEVGSSLFTHSDKLLCRRDFLRIFGKKGLCAACHRQIPAYELVMRAQEKAYHMDCFACQRCQYRFCVGDQFHMTQAHKIICLLCHREQLERCQQQQQQQQAQEREVAAGLLPAQLAGAFDGPLELASDCEKQEQLDMSNKLQAGPDEQPQLELAQLESVAREPPEPGEPATLVACPVQQMRLPSQKEQERACVM